MKTLFLVGCVLLVAGVAHGKIKDEIMPDLQKHVEPCAKEQDIPLPLDVDKFYDSSLQGEEKTKYGCMKACMMKRMELMEGGHIHPEKIVTWMEKLYEKEPEKSAKYGELIKKCHGEVASITDECEAAFQFSSCTVDNDTD